MAKFQLWSRDKYGQGNIFDTSENIDDLVKRAKIEITERNVNNALTQDDKARSWEDYFVDIFVKSNKKTKYIYGERTTLSPNTVYKVENDKISSVKLEDVEKSVVRIYLGNISANRKEEKDWYATDPKGNLIESLDHPILKEKTVFFIKKI